MDIARSINFDRLNTKSDNQPIVLKKNHQIDVSRQFDLYTTDSASYSSEAPPMYEQDQPSHGAVSTMKQASYDCGPSKSLNPPKFVLRTIPHPTRQPLSAEENHNRQSDEIRPSSQLPRPDAPLGNRIGLNTEAISESPMGRTREDETTLLCELAGASMDFTQLDESMPGRMGIVKGASTCTVRITSRRKHSPGGEIRTVRSIWVIADDGKTCMQQKLPKEGKIIPYTIWGNETKVVIRHPTELRFFASPDSPSPYKKLSTSWANYAFETASASAEFQSALLPPLLLIRTLPTTRVVRLHNSPWMRTFSARLQLCGLENLRVFQDLSDPNSLVCMIHYSPNFRPLDGEEYIIFRLYPPPRNSVRIRDDGEKCVKIKGLDIRGSPVLEQKKKGKTPQSQIEQLEEEAYGSHSIEKIKIEFESGKEKRQFLELTRELQGLSSW